MGTQDQDSGRVLPLTSAITFLGFLDTHLLIPVIALYASQLGAGTGMVGLIVGLYSIVNTPANIIFGRLIDRVGHAVPLTVGLIGDVISMILYSFARNPVHLALVRVLHGISGAIVAPSTMSLMARHSTSEGRGRAMSFYGMALASASLVGYPLSGVIATRLGYSALFFFGASVVALAVLVSFMLPHHAFAATGARAHGNTLGGVRALITRRSLMPSYAAVFAQYFTFGGVVTLLPLRVEALGMGPLEVGVLLAAFSALFVIIQLPSGAISDRVGRRVPMVAGLGCVIVSLTALPSLSGLPLLMVAMATYGVGYGLVFPSISALIADHTNAEERGLATGLFHALLTAGVAIGAPVMGWLGGLTGTGIGLVLTAIPMLLALVVALRFGRRP
jgi:MFS family permease